MKVPIAIYQDVSYHYPGSEKFALYELNLEINKGDFLGIIGPTGAGKTTLCLSLNGIVPQFYGGRFFGSISVVGLDTLEHEISLLAAHVGQVFEDPETQLIATSVENEIAFALENLKVPREEIRHRIKNALEIVRLSGMENKHPHELSGGQKQRLAIAAALALQPDLLVLDEPTSQLDSAGTEEIFQTVANLNKGIGITVIMASHSAEEMAAYASRIILLDEGSLIREGTPQEIYSQVGLLQEHSLRPPQVASTFFKLAENGRDQGSIPVRLEDAQSFLKDLSRAQPNPDFSLPEPEISPDEIILSVHDLSYSYPDGTKALETVNLDIHKGEYVLIIGQNGAGKSTLVKHFLNLLSPSEGEVRIDNISTDEFSVSQLARRIGYIAQNPDNQIFNTTVEKEVGFALTNLGYSDNEVEKRVRESLGTMDLLDVKDRHPLSLPKGDRSRVVISAMLAMDPEIVIFDEPTTGQDYQGAMSILEISKDLHQQGKTVIVITHQLYLMPEYAERVIVMGKGVILLDDDIRSAFHDVETLQKTFLSPPQAVEIARELSQLNAKIPPLLTPDEIMAYFCAHG